MAQQRPLSADELVRTVQAKLVKSGMDCTRYQRQLKDIASLFEAEKSRVELITAGHRAGAWEMFCYFKGIRHCFHSAREIASTFGIPIARGDAAVGVPSGAPKRKREGEDGEGGGGGLPMVLDDGWKLVKPDPPRKAKNAGKKSARMGSRFQNQKLVKAINAHVGMEVVCGNLRARLVSANLGGMTFELLDEYGKPMGDMVPPSQLAKRSCLAHQNNAWKSIKVDGMTLDSWVCRLQEEIEAEDGGTDGALHAAMFMQRVDEMRGPGMGDDEEEYNSGGDSDQQRSFSGGSPEKGLKLLSGAALHGRGGGGARHGNGVMLQGEESGAMGDGLPLPLPRASSRHDGDVTRIHLTGDVRNADGSSVPVAEALLQLQKASMGGEGPWELQKASMGDDPVVLQQQLHQAHETMSVLSEENKQLRAKRDRLEQLVAEKNHEIAESMKAVVGARREAHAEADTSKQMVAKLEEQLASEQAARQRAEAQLADMAKFRDGDKVLRLDVSVLDPSGSAIDPHTASRLAKLEELHAKTTETLRLLLGEAERAALKR